MLSSPAGCRCKLLEGTLSVVWEEEKLWRSNGCQVHWQSARPRAFALGIFWLSGEVPCLLLAQALQDKLPEFPTLIGPRRALGGNQVLEPRQKDKRRT